MTKKLIVLCVILAGASSLVGQTAPPKALTIRDQVYKALGGKVIRAEISPAFPENSLVQRIDLTVDRNGVTSRAYIEYFIDEKLNILQRKLYGSDNRVLWSATAPTMTEQERIEGWGKCIDECRRVYNRQTRRSRARYALCALACDQIFDPNWFGDPIR
jgi:hypothetical protein